MAKNEAKAKSGRKPFRDISNGGNSSKPLKKKVPQNDESALDRLLLVHSDLSTFIHQIDELVVQALNLKTSSAESWKISKNDSFSVRSLYQSLTLASSEPFIWSIIWRSWAPMRVSFFAWEASCNRISTIDQLKR